MMIEQKIEAHEIAPAMLFTSRKNGRIGPKVFQQTAQRTVGFEKIETPQIEAIRGCMLESFIQAGTVSPEHCSEKSEYGKSITDPCMSWEMTESLLTEAADIWTGQLH